MRRLFVIIVSKIPVRTEQIRSQYSLEPRCSARIGDQTPYTDRMGQRKSPEQPPPPNLTRGRITSEPLQGEDQHIHQAKHGQTHVAQRTEYRQYQPSKLKKHEGFFKNSTVIEPKLSALDKGQDLFLIGAKGFLIGTQRNGR